MRVNGEFKADALRRRNTFAHQNNNSNRLNTCRVPEKVQR